MKKRIDWLDIEQIFKNNHIDTLYHFTDRSNLESIVRNGGIFSWGDCLKKCIHVNAPGGSDLSHDLDRKEGLEDYVRVSFCHYHPMMYFALNEKRIKDPIILEIDTDLAYLDGVIFSDRNAVKNNAQKGESIIFLNNVHFDTVKQKHLYDVPEEDRDFYQAELLIPHFIPLQYIKNLDKYVSIKDKELKDFVCNSIYSKEINSTSPSALFFIISQSSHIGKLIDYQGEKTTKSKIVSDTINEILYALLLNNNSENLKSKFDISIIGYNDYGYLCLPQSKGSWINMDKLLDSSNDTTKIKKIIKTRNGGKILEKEVPVWIKPKSNLGAELGSALKYCYSIVKSWIEKHPDSYPPLVIHITDSGYTDQDHSRVISLANDIKNLSTTNGNTVLINLIFEDLKNSTKTIFPSVSKGNDRLNAFIDAYYEMSSYLPFPMKDSNPLISDKYQDYKGIAYNINPQDLFSIMEILVK